MILENVPVQYMQCNASAFAKGDNVVVKFMGQDWNKPCVIGFRDHPKPCNEGVFCAMFELPWNQNFPNDWESHPKLITAAEMFVRQYFVFKDGKITPITAEKAFEFAYPKDTWSEILVRNWIYNYNDIHLPGTPSACIPYHFAASGRNWLGSTGQAIIDLPEFKLAMGTSFFHAFAFTPNSSRWAWGSSIPATPITPDLFRPDGTRKGPGWLGPLRNIEGGWCTELSIGVEIGGEEVEIPSMVPTLTASEINWLLALKDPTREIIEKAAAFATVRIVQGLSPFKEGIWDPPSVPILIFEKNAERPQRTVYWWRYHTLLTVHSYTPAYDVWNIIPAWEYGDNPPPPGPDVKYISGIPYRRVVYPEVNDSGTYDLGDGSVESDAPSFPLASGSRVTGDGFTIITWTYNYTPFESGSDIVPGDCGKTVSHPLNESNVTSETDVYRTTEAAPDLVRYSSLTHFVLSEFTLPADFPLAPGLVIPFRMRIEDNGGGYYTIYMRLIAMAPDGNPEGMENLTATAIVWKNGTISALTIDSSVIPSTTGAFVLYDSDLGIEKVAVDHGLNKSVLTRLTDQNDPLGNGYSMDFYVLLTAAIPGWRSRPGWSFNGICRLLPRSAESYGGPAPVVKPRTSKGTVKTAQANIYAAPGIASGNPPVSQKAAGTDLDLYEQKDV